MRIFHFIIFLSFFSTAYLLLHYYSISWVIRNFNLSLSAAKTTKLIFLLMALFSISGMLVKRYFSHGFVEYFLICGYLWMGIMVIFPSIFLLYDILKFSLGKYFQFSPQIALAFVLLAFLISIYSTHEGTRLPGFKNISIKIKNLPDELNNIRIVQLSDWHMDFSYKARQFAVIIEEVKKQKPDLVVFTGDLLDPPGYCNSGMGKAMKSLKPPFGMFACMGNHEHYYGLKKSMECYKKLGIKTLINETQGFDNFQLIGFADIKTTNISLKKALKTVQRLDNNKFKIILSHHPFYFSELAEKYNLIMLSGHTHGGQIFPFHFLTRAFYKFFYGLYQKKDSFLYVTSGSGSWGPPMRLLAPSEIPIITLKKAD